MSLKVRMNITSNKRNPLGRGEPDDGARERQLHEPDRDDRNRGDQERDNDVQIAERQIGKTERGEDQEVERPPPVRAERFPVSRARKKRRRKLSGALGSSAIVLDLGLRP